MKKIILALSLLSSPINAQGIGQSSAVGPVSAPQGRITLLTHTPVMIISQSAKTTFYYDCYKGNGKVPYYNGVTDAMDTIPSCEVSNLMAASGTGVISANSVFDVWWVRTGANRICVATNGSGGGWASDTGGSNTARGTGYSQLDQTTRGYVTNTNSINTCYNNTTNYGPISANRATYLGTIKTDTSSAGTINWIFGNVASGGGAAEFGICNYYNRVTVKTMVQDSATTWTYAIALWRAFNGAGTGSGLNNRVTYVSCNGEYPVSARLSTILKTNTTNNTSPAISIGVNTITPNSASVGITSAITSTQVSAEFFGNPGSGINFLQAVEFGNATNAPSFYGRTTLNGVNIVETFTFDGQF